MENRIEEIELKKPASETSEDNIVSPTQILKTVTTYQKIYVLKISRDRTKVRDDFTNMVLYSDQWVYNSFEEADAKKKEFESQWYQCIINIINKYVE